MTIASDECTIAALFGNDEFVDSHRWTMFGKESGQNIAYHSQNE
jgi:hypothetical protein